MKTISKLTCALACVALLVAFAIPTPAVAQKPPPGPEGLEKPDGESEPGYLEDEVLVRFKQRRFTRHGATRGPLAKYGARSIKRNPRFGIHRVKLPKGMSVAEAIARLSQDDAVEHVQPNYVYRILRTTPPDPLFAQQWALDNASDADIDAPEAWDITTGSSDVVVAVIDTGVDYTHPDLAANMWVNEAEANGDPEFDDDGNGKDDDIYGYDFVNDDGDPMDDHSHGTHCAGIVGAASNTQGVVGVNWQVKIMALKTCNAGGYCPIFNMIDALSYVMDMKSRGVNVKITSNSYGGFGSNQDFYTAIQAARDADILFVAAAGNYHNDNDRRPFSPASYDLENIIAVAASNQSDELASFSHWGLRTVDLAAPGTAILSTVPAGGYENMTGTSMATPHVAGVAALVYSVYPGYDYQEVKASVLAAVDPLPDADDLLLTGGRLNAHGAVGPPPAWVPDIWVYPTGFNVIAYPTELQTVELSILNRGPGTLELEITENASWLEIDPAQATVPGFSATDVSLTVDAQGLDPGDYAVDILIESNDPDESSLILPMSLTVSEGHVDVSVVLQGTSRPLPDGWEIPLTIALFEPGSDVLFDQPIYEGTKAASWSRGYASARIPDVPGTYDLTVDSEHTLLNVLRNVVISPSNKEVMMGTLLEGDCNDDHGIGFDDYNVMWPAFDWCQGDPKYNARADLDRDGCVAMPDYDLMVANWGKASPIEVSYEADVELSMVLEGDLRPDPAGWEVPVSVGFFHPGADVLSDDPQYLFETTTTKAGGYAVAQVTGVQPGVYDVTVDSEHTLLNVMRSVVISAPSTSLDMDTLLEGDCDDNHAIGVSDLIILSNAYGWCEGDPRYDPRADLDRDGCVGGDDYDLMSGNWGKASPIEIPYVAEVALSMFLQGAQRPDPAGWEVPVTVAFFEPGADVLSDDPQYVFEETTVKAGGQAVAQVTGVPPGVYDVTVDSEHTLMNVKRNVTIAAPSTDVGMGVLLEGDCDDNHAIDANDYIILAAAYGWCQGDPKYDARADLDRDGCAGDDDYALMLANWQKTSPIEVPDVELFVALQGPLRPDPAGWDIPGTIGFFEPGADVLSDDPQYLFEVDLSKSGSFTVTQATVVPPGTYDVSVDSEHTLMNVKRDVVIATPRTEVIMGLLLEGDSDDNHAVGMSDYIILANAYGWCEGDPRYDPRADLDRDGCVGDDDYAFIEANWGKASPIEVP